LFLCWEGFRFSRKREIVGIKEEEEEKKEEWL
jgi:hypothetical protein